MLIDHPIGGKLFDDFLWTQDVTGNLRVQRLVKQYKKCMHMKGDQRRLGDKAEMSSFFHTCPSMRWTLRMQKTALCSSPRTMRRNLNSYFDSLKEELRKEKDIMNLFYQSIYVEVKRRNDELIKRLRRERSVKHRIAKFLKFW